jgi:hypothetical protein
LAVAPALAALLLANPGSGDLGDLGWSILAIPVGAAIGTFARAAQLHAEGAERGFAVVLACAMGLVGVVIGIGVWIAALGRACGDRYECPF